MFFTKNGEMLGVAYTAVKPDNWVPGWSLTSGQKVSLNTGQKPWVYNFDKPEIVANRKDVQIGAFSKWNNDFTLPDRKDPLSCEWDHPNNYNGLFVASSAFVDDKYKVRFSRAF